MLAFALTAFPTGFFHKDNPRRKYKSETFVTIKQ